MKKPICSFIFQIDKSFKTLADPAKLFLGCCDNLFFIGCVKDPKVMSKASNLWWLTAKVSNSQSGLEDVWQEISPIIFLEDQSDMQNADTSWQKPNN